MRIGIADHLGWVVAVTASPDHDVVDRRRIDLLEPGLPAAPIHYEGGTWPQHGSGWLDDADLAAVVERVRASAARATSLAFDGLAADLPGPVEAVVLRAWPDLPEDIAVLRRPPYEARADAVMYRQVLAQVAAERGWGVHVYDARSVLTAASALLGDRADAVLDGPRARLGAPWTKDHRTALAATIVSGRSR